MRRTLLAVVALALLATASATAQGGIEHRGLWAGLHAGYGWASYGGDVDEDARGGFAAGLRLGGTLAPNLLLGGESNGWYGRDDEVDSIWGSLMAVAYFYPVSTLPLFVKGGAGGMYTVRSDAPRDVTSSHFAFQLGAGYDLEIGSDVAVTFTATYLQGLSADWNADDVAIGSVSPNIIMLGVGISLY
ncbi:MAG: outer membrane beta-barrel protein [Gemmatimonadales bacterium]|jgi:opacity protein-like surface antigen|nr:outer membrane beta-barrel protein [Gemmatimonadales bacterium]